MSYNPFNYSILDSDNTTDTLLTAGSTFTGTSVQDFVYPHLFVQAATDQDGEIRVQFSNDNANWDTTLTIPYINGSINVPQPIFKSGRYHRVIFENTSASDQTYLRLYTYLGVATELTSNLNGTISQVFPATVSRPTDYFIEVAAGKRQGVSNVNKFGYNNDVDSAAEEVVASFGGSIGIMTTADTLDVSSDDANDTSAGTGARTILISGIGADFLSQVEVVTLNGLTAVTTSNTWLGVNRVVVLSSGSGGKNAGNINLLDTSGTVGTQAQIPTEASVTQQAIYHTQISHSLFLDFLYINVNKLSGGASPKVTIRGYSFSRVTLTTYEVYKQTIDSSSENTVELNLRNPFIYTGREVVYFTAETDTNNTIVNLRFGGIEEKQI